jgi:hypothetical protein
MRARDAREIRRGILLARQVLRKERVGPRDVSLYSIRPSRPLALWERAYVHEMRRRLIGRRPPIGGSGVTPPPRPALARPDVSGVFARKAEGR